MSILGSIGMGDVNVIDDRLKQLESYNHSFNLNTRRTHVAMVIDDPIAKKSHFYERNVDIDDDNDLLSDYMRRNNIEKLSAIKDESIPVLMHFLKEYFSIEKLYVYSFYFKVK